MSHARTLDRKTSLLLGLAAAAFALILLPKPSHAMTISPPVLDFTLNPGDVVQDVVQVYNEQDVPFKIEPAVVNFYATPGDETSGTPSFYPASEDRTGYELASWIQLTGGEEIVGPHARVNYPISIHVPADAAPGSHFGAVEILAGAPDEDLSKGGAVNLNLGTSVLIFARVNGNAREELSVSRFSGDKSMYSRLPVDFGIRLDNTGTTHLRPTGDVFVRDMFNRQVATLLVNPGPDFKTILPGTSRRFDAEWVKTKLPPNTNEFWQEVRNFGFGKYKATLVLNYGQDNKVLTSEFDFWVFSWLAFAALLGIILVLCLIFFGGLRGYNQLVIRRYEAQKKSQQH